MNRIFRLTFFGLSMLLIASCTFTKKIKDGTMAYELHQYAVAVDMLSDEYQEANDQGARARIAYTIGESYWKMGEVDQALPWYSKAVSDNFGPRAKEKRAFALKHLQRYNDAIDEFRNLLNEGSEIDLYRKEIAICRLAADWLNRENQKYDVDKTLFNSRDSDYSPVFLDDQHIFFSSDRATGSSENSYNWTGRNYSDIYIYNTYSGEVSHVDPVINSEHNEGTMSISQDGKTLFFTRCYTDTELDDYCKIMVSYFENQRWSEPKLLPFIEENINYGHPHWVDDDSVLFFSSQQNSGKGGFDLYFSRLDTLGVWTRPQILSDIINTMGDEKFPTVKNDTLYFASDGHLGMGGLDIFYTYIAENGNWVQPKNMKSPINSGADDFSIVFEQFGGTFKESGYFTSSRNGSDDIFSFKPSTKKLVVKDPNVELPKEEDYSLKLAVTILAVDETGSKVKFPRAKVLINGSPEKLNARSFLLKEITPGSYSISVSHPGYFAMKAIVTTTYRDIEQGKADYTYNKTLILKPIVENEEIVLENILYDFNKSFIREDAEPSLNELTSLLQENPSILIELSSHTDCRGPNDYNQKLSQERAQSAVNYIVARGIDGSRITAKGYGESAPVASCECDSCTEDEHQSNRRTAFKIVGTK